MYSLLVLAHEEQTSPGGHTDSNSPILASVALTGGDISDAVHPALAAAGACLLAVTSSIHMTATVGLAHEWLNLTTAGLHGVVNTIQKASASIARCL